MRNDSKGKIEAKIDAKIDVKIDAKNDAKNDANKSDVKADAGVPLVDYQVNRTTNTPVFSLVRCRKI